MDVKGSILCSLLALLCIRGTLSYDHESSITGLYTGPYFDPLAKKNLSAHLGERAILPCTVRQLGDKSVSWVRMRDADILTVDRYTFVGDERFESRYSEMRETWSLIIKYVQQRDAGLYECQVSTEPKMSQIFSLRIVVPKVSIVPPTDRYMNAGSRVRIDCQINDVVMLPDYIFWYHGDVRMMENKDPNVVVTVKRTGVESITSTLTILEVPAEASGNYTCMPSNLHSASAILHVLEEKLPEAMQGDRSGSTRLASGSRLHLLLLLLLLLVVFSCAFPCSSINDTSHHQTLLPQALSPRHLVQTTTTLLATRGDDDGPFFQDRMLLFIKTPRSCSFSSSSPSSSFAASPPPPPLPSPENSSSSFSSSTFSSSPSRSFPSTSFSVSFPSKRIFPLSGTFASSSFSSSITSSSRSSSGTPSYASSSNSPIPFLSILFQPTDPVSLVQFPIPDDVPSPMEGKGHLQEKGHITFRGNTPSEVHASG